MHLFTFYQIEISYCSARKQLAMNVVCDRMRPFIVIPFIPAERINNFNYGYDLRTNYVVIVSRVNGNRAEEDSRSTGE